MMTGLLSEKEFSRKTFVKGGGALVVTVVAASAAGKASAANGLTPFTQRGPQDFLPDLTQIDAWITITKDNKCIVTHGETELGHGTPTGILMLTAEELNMTMDQMVYAHPETWLNATGGGGRQRRHLDPVDEHPRRGGAREADAAEHGVDAARRPGGEPVGHGRRRSPAAARPSSTAT